MSELQDRPVTLGGQTYTIRFSIRAMLALKEKWGLSEGEVQKRLKGAKIDDFPVIMWAGLRTHHPELTEDQVLGWLDDGGVSGMGEALKAVEASQPPEPDRP